VAGTLEGPGISKSECPTCGLPVWKKDLVHNCKVRWCGCRGVRGSARTRVTVRQAINCRDFARIRFLHA
jgi:hypothetical protein